MRGAYRLEELSLQGCERLTNKSMHVLSYSSTAASLISLDVSSCRSIDACGLSIVFKMCQKLQITAADGPKSWPDVLGPLHNGNEASRFGGLRLFSNPSGLMRDSITVAPSLIRLSLDRHQDIDDVALNA